MDTLEAIHTRRSIRHYTGEPVSNELLNEILRAAMAAPSAGNQRPWFFVVLDDRKTLDAIPCYHEYASMLRQAPLAIAVCADKRKEVYPGYWVQDCSAATQNLLLAAHALGLGAVWLGIYPIESRVQATQNLLELPREVIPLALVALGHTDSKGGRVERFDPGRIFRNRWDRA